jgi:hypothetical protein
LNNELKESDSDNGNDGSKEKSESKIAQSKHKDDSQDKADNAKAQVSEKVSKSIENDIQNKFQKNYSDNGNKDSKEKSESKIAETKPNDDSQNEENRRLPQFVPKSIKDIENDHVETPSTVSKSTKNGHESAAGSNYLETNDKDDKHKEEHKTIDLKTKVIQSISTKYGENKKIAESKLAENNMIDDAKKSSTVSESKENQNSNEIYSEDEAEDSKQPNSEKHSIKKGE